MNTVQKTIVGAQFLFVAFGATVIVPLLVGLDPSVGLFTAGVGTLIFHAITKGKVPIFLGCNWLLAIIALLTTVIVSLFGNASVVISAHMSVRQEPFHLLIE